MKCKCPACGTKFKLKVKKAKSDLAEVVPVKPARLPGVDPRKVPTPITYRTSTDVGKFRQALHNAGFIAEASKSIFNDKRMNSRRLKLWFGRNVFAASEAEQRKLIEELQNQFGDRLMECGKSSTTSPSFGPGPGASRFSYIVRLTD